VGGFIYSIWSIDTKPVMYIARFPRY